MTDKPDTNLPGSKPEAGGVEGEGSYTAARDQNELFARDAERALQGDERDALLGAEALARVKTSY